MSSEQICVRMLGGFSIAPGDQSEGELNNAAGRARRIWSLIEYLIVHRDREVAVTELVDILWPSQEREDPLKTLQHNVSRARDMLDKLGIPDARDLIVAQNGCYRWNPQRETTVDAEEFQRLCVQADGESDDDRRLALEKEALALYRGDFLPGTESEAWAMSISAYYRSLYMARCLSAVRCLWQRDRWQEVAAVCEPALRLAPESEELSAYFIRALTALSQPQRALAVYDRTRRFLSESLGVIPSDALELAREEAAKSLSGQRMDVDAVRSLLTEAQYIGGAFFCDWSTFRSLVRREARDVDRAGHETHLLIVSLEGGNSPATDCKRLERVLGSNLRCGDSFTRLNTNQFLVMLPSARGDNVKTIVERLDNTFSRMYPRSRANLRYGWYRLEQTGISKTG